MDIGISVKAQPLIYRVLQKELKEINYVFFTNSLSFRAFLGRSVDARHYCFSCYRESL